MSVSLVISLAVFDTILIGLSFVPFFARFKSELRMVGALGIATLVFIWGYQQGLLG